MKNISIYPIYHDIVLDMYHGRELTQQGGVWPSVSKKLCSSAYILYYYNVRLQLNVMHSVIQPLIHHVSSIYNRGRVTSCVLCSGLKSQDECSDGSRGRVFVLAKRDVTRDVMQ